MRMTDRLREWAKRLKRDGITLWFAVKYPHVPWYAKALGVFVVAYALSPIDLIPDFIPIPGYLDDVLLLPGLIWLTIRLIPPPLVEVCRVKADQWMQATQAKPVSRVGGAVIVGIWVAVALLAWKWCEGLA